MRHSSVSLLPTIVALSALIIVPCSATAQGTPITPDQLTELRFRSVGPAVAGGRIHDVEALPDDPSTIYLAMASGGIWKSTNKGTTWEPIFDDQPVSTFGDLSIAPSNPEVLWAGTGEQNNRQSTSWGNGVYRSLDGGETWTHLGLDDTRHISRVLVHPDDPDVAFVGALGTLWAPSEERGVFKTTDGGHTWSKVLFVDTYTGIIDMEMDPANPDILYAASYQRLRRAWGMNGGGPGSGIFKSTDGGRTWKELTNGLPEGNKGRIGLAISETMPNVLNALVEHAEDPGVYRTEDGGTSWEKVNPLNPRPMYYSHIAIDPTNDQRIYVLATSFSKSEDGGNGFMTLPTRPTYDVGVHSDFHDMWIDPGNPSHFYLAGDGGLHETWDMGRTYIKINNIPFGQFYGIGVDMREPYYIYGGMQDNHSWMGPSATRHWIGIINDDWQQIGFGDGMYQQPDPTSHRYVYVLAQNGNILRLDAETGDHLNVRPHPQEGEDAYRFDWVTPAIVSQHDPNVVYLGGNRLFISRNRGVSWDRTDDLTHQIDRDTLELMGVPGSETMLSKNDGTGSFGEITTIAESPLVASILWVGADDGALQVSRDAGRTWTEVSSNVTGLREFTYVSRVVASVTAPGTAYATFDAHRDGDFAPYVYRTTDFGITWEPLMTGLPSGSANVIIEHRDSPSLLFLGTEHALYASTDGGAHWAMFEELPTTLYDDLLIHPRDNDLIVGTHGRSIWILDDVTPLVEWNTVTTDVPHLFTVRRATIFQYWKDTSYRGQGAYAGENPPFGAILTYRLPRDVEEATITVTNPHGELVRTIDVPATEGTHRLTWDLRHEPPRGTGRPGFQQQGLPQSVGARGPFVSPGPYTVTLTADGTISTQNVEVIGDPMMNLTADQWNERETFLLGILEAQRRLSEAANAMEPEMQQELRRVQRSLSSLANEFNGSGVQQGTLYPPTRTHLERWRVLEREVSELLGS